MPYAKPSPIAWPPVATTQQTQFAAHQRDQYDDTAGRGMRRFDRIPVHVPAVLYLGSKSQFTVIRDISPAGARLEGAAGVFPGDTIRLTLVTGHAKTANVRWWLNGSCGVAFTTLMDADDPFIARAIRHARKSAEKAEREAMITDMLKQRI